MTNTNDIAICISGETRTGIEASKSFFNFFNFNADIFYHTWSTSPEIEKKIQQIYRPIRCLISKQEEYEHRRPFSSMLYSLMAANTLKKQEEIKRKQRYKLVIRARFDTIYLPSIPFPLNSIELRSIYASVAGMGFNHIDYENHTLNDVIFWGDSASMDVISNTYKYYKTKCLPIIDNIISEQTSLYPADAMYSPGILMYRECIKHNIKLISAPSVGDVLLRDTVKHLDPINDYYKIQEYLRLKGFKNINNFIKEK